MIQRIQSIYLFLVFAFSVVMLFTPLVTFLAVSQPDGIVLKAFHYTTLTNEVFPESSILFSLGGVISLVAILSLVAIFLFKNRALQIRLSIYIMIFLVAIMGLIYFYSYKIVADNEVDYKVHVFALFPIISIILAFLAFNAIRKDEALIKSINRIR
ncbi:MAG: DUF4293 domain-containing protein [Bacteroidales bacterium]|nr:DUF4293 domain-containing protein [Bacteroidales bacterium]